ncbi:tetratricopeptide repeat protein [Sphingomonas flavalba]|uniref:tetratricopeptide repeat protein n=1 Tax=Sphingomonas flavalba TaxID=2559804 RepID=UPI0039E15E7B
MSDQTSEANPDGATRRRSLVLRALVAGPVAIVCLWLVVVTGVAGNQRSRNPAIAYQIWPVDARASAMLGSERLLAAPKPDVAAAARELALTAFQRDPTVLAVYNVLGMAADIGGDRPAAERIFNYAHRLSRRDLATELWLIEANVARNDVNGALTHFDAAMSTSRRGWETLSPILLAALDDPELVTPIARLASRGRWWSFAFQHLVATQAPSLPSATRFFMQLDAMGVRPNESSTQSLAFRLVNAHMPDRAAALDALTTGGNAEAGIRDGGFEQQQGLVPFRWQFLENDKVAAERIARSDKQSDIALNFSVERGMSNAIMRQLVALAPGDHTLSVEGFAEEGGANWALSWVVSCENTKALVAAMPWPISTGDWAVHKARFTVPTGCPFQWITLIADSERNAGRLIGWVDTVAVMPTR